MSRCPTCHRRIAADTTCPRDGSPSRPRHERVQMGPPLVPDLQMRALLGAGGTSLVWEAEGADGLVAVKVANGPGLAERFRREADALLTIGAPHVPELLASGRLASHLPYIVMERLAGQSLAGLLETASAPMTCERALAIADGLLDSLAAVHACGYVHRDLKPENVQVRDGEVRLMDLGLVSAPQVRPATRVQFGMGTAEYMAPEQLCSHPVADARTDLYAFGVVVYEMLTLRPPFAGPRHAVIHGHLERTPPPPRTFARLPERLERLLLDCLDKDPANRPASAAELRSALTTM